tara:strand:+ start:72 stop:899 length:828 start_codon:yes stop_codon:yes gene_type:complete
MILVVGSDSNLAKRFIRDFNDKSSLILTSRKDQNKLNLDLRNFKEIKNLPNGINKALIFAGITGIEYCRNNQELVKSINLEATSKLVEYLNQKDIRCLFISTNCVFSEKTQSTSEASERDPSNTYGVYKKLLEDRILTSKNNSILRLTKVLDSESGIINSWISKIEKNQKIEAFSNIKISPITTNFVSQFLRKWCLENIFEQNVFHLSNEIEISYYDLALEIIKKTKSEFKNIFKIEADLSKQKNFVPIKASLECDLKYSKYQKFNVLIEELINN